MVAVLVVAVAEVVVLVLVSKVLIGMIVVVVTEWFFILDGLDFGFCWKPSVVVI